MKRLAFPAVAAFLFPLGIWWVVFSEGLLVRFFESSLAPYDLHADFIHLKKGPFYNFESHSLLLKRSGKPLFSIDHFAARIHPLLLFLMRPTLSFHGVIGGGDIAGKMGRPYGRGAQGQLRFDRIPLDAISFLADRGVAGSGVITGEGRLDDYRGEFTFSIQALRLKSESFWGVVIPLDLFVRGRGIISMDEERIRIGSLSLEGDRVYARVKGTIARETTDLTIEIMPDPLLVRERSQSFSLIENFKVSPGYYVIPIQGKFSL